MEKFNKAQAKNLAAAKKLVDTYASSSEDEGELDEKHILDLLYKHYKPSPDNSSTSNNANRTATFLENSLHSGAATCLICIGSIRRVEGIWSCKSCYCFFHLKCIQRWANDSVMQMKVKAEQQNGSQGHYNHLGEFVPPKRPKSLHWCCPQCRTDYQPADRPTQYECFCGKEVNPQAQPFLVPHSCGEICGKLLQPKCGHDCKLLCHPGPCPPCAQLAHSACLCGKSAPRSVRCIDKNWQCQQMCQSLLSCGKHKCNQRCHRSGQCPPCSSKSSQYCDCKREQKVVNCAEPKWKCKNICGALFDCGLHSCDKVCHAGPCGGECPLGVRSCPCGKSVKTGGCSEVLETCGDTCQKVLSCGKHSCAQRCHRGPCNLCLVRTTKKCRCGLHEKELPCSKDFTCETKCKLIRDCNKHACNRKCCGDQCPPCEKICGKQLSCNKHKCQSVCHNGPCYPCKLESQVNCRCGKTRRSVPCGREKSARIVCQELCRISAKCQHAIKHRCHKGECPPCAQQCGLPNDISGCGHICKVRCHAAIRVPKPADAVRPHANKYEYRAQPHPRCEEGISVTCIGGHEVATWPCWNSKPQSCARKCGRQLKCGNHKCQLFCHAVPNLVDMQQQIGCSNCEQGCAIARPAGCTHACAKGCHPPPCAPCSFVIKNKCHCGLNQVIYKCSEFFNQEGSVQDILDRRQKLCSCGNRCLKNFACGHRCMTICHPGPCPNPDMCRKKVKIYCACKRIKLEIACDKHRAGQTSLECDDNCQAERVRAEALEQQNEDRRMRYVEERNQRELERFKQLFAKRKPKERKAIDVPTTKSNIDWKRCAIYAVALFAALGALAVAYYAES